uniref:Tetratricopeptide repeat-containing protein n=1 Tax=Candidatus Kentrum sp. DK TaxID=2126562 RepID=A0A450SUV3_9GAMM|nr:MAG: Tetratricopeptide repeat-containing protein [Candidatus Kentron sp. DK]
MNGGDIFIPIIDALLNLQRNIATQNQEDGMYKETVNYIAGILKTTSIPNVITAVSTLVLAVVAVLSLIYRNEAPRTVVTQEYLNTGSKTNYINTSTSGNVSDFSKKRTVANGLRELARDAQVEGDLDKARDRLEQSINIDKEIDNKEGMAVAFSNLGLIASAQHKWDEAEGYHNDSLTMETALGRRDGMAADLNNLGFIAQTRGDLKKAEDYYKKALSLYERLRSKEGIIIQSNNLSTIYLMQGKLDDAKYYRRSLFSKVDI